jgi:hypothetical protein
METCHTMFIEIVQQVSHLNKYDKSLIFWTLLSHIYLLGCEVSATATWKAILNGGISSKADTREWYLNCFVCLVRLMGSYGENRTVSDDTIYEISHVSFSSCRRKGVMIAWLWINHTLHLCGQLYGYLWCVVTVSHTVGNFIFDDDVSDVSVFFTYTWLAKSVYIFLVYGISILSSTPLKY